MNVDDLRRRSDQLGFTPQHQVRWLSPGELCRTAVKVALSSVFANYADKRELQGVFPGVMLSVPPDDRASDRAADRASDRDGVTEVWIDFVADTGDGFDATFTVASLLAQEQLTVRPARSSPSTTPRATLPRGSLLVLGGDEVYPVASAQAYEDRTKGPFRAALPGAAPPGAVDSPLMVALPGNHDWYDGLTSFLRVFTQGRAIGGWRTQQSRSYFAVRLPQGWWLLGLDSQFGTYIDGPQLDYFATHVSAHLQQGDAVILCAATPVWVKAAEGDGDAFNSLHWFERNIVRTRLDDTGQRVPTGASTRLWITGDQHHYVRYGETLPPEAPETSARQLVTCGLGGAYLSATHRLPSSLVLPPDSSHLRDRDRPGLPFAVAEATYPSRGESRTMARGLADPRARGWLPRRNPGFGALAGCVHVVLFLALSYLFARSQGRSTPDALRSASPLETAVFSFWALLVLVVVIGVIWAFQLFRARAIKRPSSAAAAVLFQLVVGLSFLVAVTALPLPEQGSDWFLWAAAVVGAFAAGWVLGSEAFALYTLVAKSGTVAGWQMSGQSIEDHKGFVRMHLDSQGSLTLYPLVVDTICREWTTVPDVDLIGERPAPEGALPVPRLVEPPVTITREGFQG